MLPRKSVRVGCFDYKIVVYEASSSASEDHGETNLERKIINLWHNGNEQVLRETLLHEIEHVIYEDVLSSAKDIEDEEKKEETIIRLVNPRRLQTVQDNKVLFRWIYDL